jgi:hypothetical protein
MSATAAKRMTDLAGDSYLPCAHADSVRERGGAGGGDRLVSIAIAAADPDCPDDRSTTPQRSAAGEDHHAPMVRELLAS